MKAYRLVVYLIEMVKHQIKVQIAREILAQNMNFSPAWTLALLHQNQQQPENQTLRISHFLQLFDMINYKCTKQEAANILEYFDRNKKNEVQNQYFVHALLPTQREGLRKVVIKRSAQDLEWTKDLKYAFKRFFMEVNTCSKHLKDYQTDFIDLSMSFAGTNEQQLTRGEVCQFLKKHNKYPTEAEILCIMTQIEGKRLKQINGNVLKNIIWESLKDKSSGIEGTPLHASYRGNRQPTQKSHFADKSVSQLPEPKVIKTVSIFKPGESSEDADLKKSTRVYEVKVDKVKERDLQETPIGRLPKSSLKDETYKIHYPSQRRNQLNTELSALQSQNEEMRSEMVKRKAQNSSMLNNIRKDLRTLGNQ